MGPRHYTPRPQRTYSSACTSSAEKNRAERYAFLSQRNIDATAGYARAQLRKMRRGSYKGYMGERRKALVDSVGYDPKNAAHCCRLLLQGCRLLETGRLEVKPPAEHLGTLIQIKEGGVPFTPLQDYVDDLSDRFANLEIRHRGEFPPQVPRETSNRILLAAFRALGEEWRNY